MSGGFGSMLLGGEFFKVDTAMDALNSGKDREPVKNLKSFKDVFFHVLAPRF